MSRITITRRHTGRYYIGLDMKRFMALYGLILMADGIQKQFSFALTSKEDEREVIAAFKAYAKKIREIAKS